MITSPTRPQTLKTTPRRVLFTTVPDSLHAYIKHLFNEYLPHSVHFFSILLAFSMFQSVKGILNLDSIGVFLIPSDYVIYTYR